MIWGLSVLVGKAVGETESVGVGRFVGCDELVGTTVEGIAT